MQTPPPTPLPRVRAWLAGHWLAIVGTALGCLGLFYLLPAPGSPAAQRPATLLLSSRQVRQASQAQVARLDSIRRELRKIPALTQARDRALAAARRQNTRANHLLTLLAHEAPPPAIPAPAQSTKHLARTLAAYQPGSYALDSTHSLR